MVEAALSSNLLYRMAWDGMLDGKHVISPDRGRLTACTAAGIGGGIWNQGNAHKGCFHVFFLSFMEHGF
jgi:hypothetical protein